jgi:cytochrome b561
MIEGEFETEMLRRSTQGRSHQWGTKAREVIGLATACAVVAHFGAALHHHFMRKDAVLMRTISN